MDIGKDVNEVIMSNRIVICPYCGKKAEYVKGDRIYSGRGSWDNKFFWVCFSCDAWVGCHSKDKRFGRIGDEPLGRLANEELRKAKMRAHKAFDPLWKDNDIRRKDAYVWLSEELGVPFDECHIGMFDVDMCERVIEAVSNIKYSRVVAKSICGQLKGLR